jgi:hypothetical protein
MEVGDNLIFHLLFLIITLFKKKNKKKEEKEEIVVALTFSGFYNVGASPLIREGTSNT